MTFAENAHKMLFFLTKLKILIRLQHFRQNLVEIFTNSTQCVFKLG